MMESVFEFVMKHSVAMMVCFCLAVVLIILFSFDEAKETYSNSMTRRKIRRFNGIKAESPERAMNHWIVPELGDEYTFEDGTSGKVNFRNAEPDRESGANMWSVWVYYGE